MNSKVLYLSLKTKIVVLCSRDHPLNGVARSKQASKGVGQEEGKKEKNLPLNPQTYLLVCSRTTCKIVTFFVNASRLGEKLKKVPF